ncbi:MAG: hypothetical protein KJO32_15155 [Deltaproteobacteria bacterium]|nr:hypothetical protein [Deltaproteobacteria bacterium]
MSIEDPPDCQGHINDASTISIRQKPAPSPVSRIYAARWDRKWRPSSDPPGDRPGRSSRCRSSGIVGLDGTESGLLEPVGFDDGVKVCALTNRLNNDITRNYPFRSLC